MVGIKIEGWLYNKNKENMNEKDLDNLVDDFTKFIESRNLLFTTTYHLCTEKEYCEEGGE